MYINQINPFDNLHFKKGLGQTENIGAPQKIDEQNSPAQIQEGAAIQSLPKSDENDFVDMSSMVDDSGDFNSSNFNFEDKNAANEINNTDNQNNESQNQNNQNEEEIKEEVNQFVNDLLEKKN